MENTCGESAGGDSYCWGRGDYNLLQQPVAKACVFKVTQGGYQDRCTATPLPILTNPALASLTPGADAICGLTSGGQAYCWGRGTSGQLGNGSTADSPDPVAVAGGHAFTSLAGGNYFFCGVDTATRVWCWGKNDHGQLGDGTTTDRATPVAAF
jgi:alpha-tubulin suppressor-like RCC1 family protein